MSLLSTIERKLLGAEYSVWMVARYLAQMRNDRQEAEDCWMQANRINQKLQLLEMSL